MATDIDTDRCVDVVVVGAGLAGLAAGATAAAGGAKTVVLDAHRPGGRARVTERRGYVFNLGAHALYLKGPGMAVLNSLGIDPPGVPPPLGRYHALSDGNLEVLPTGAGSAIHSKLLGSRDKAQFALLFARLLRLEATSLSTHSVQEWLGALSLRARVEGLLKALIRLSTYTADVESFSADAAVGQLQAGIRGGVRYLDGGWGTLVEALATKAEVVQHLPVTGIEPGPSSLLVQTKEGQLRARRVIVAAGSPDAARRLLPTTEVAVGPAVTAACLDVGTTSVPRPGYVLSLDDPLYATTQGPPARQAPPGAAVVAALRYGARQASEDRPQLEALLATAGVEADHVVVERYLAKMTVAGAMPTKALGGLPGRPKITDSGLPGVLLAGDWVGPEGLLADAALVSGQQAAKAALKGLDAVSRRRRPVMLSP
jgi:glycine/D-amino acid oxidase-like deaminating enzyme